MAKILEVNNSVVSIGTEDGGIKEVRAADLNFVPHVGDEVEVFETETKTIVSKVEPKTTTLPNGGININVENSNNNANAQPVYVKGKVVNKVTYCLLAFFLGAIGVHKFYVGKTGTGILFLLFCWTAIPAFIALIDFIIGLTKKADAQGNIVV